VRAAVAWNPDSEQYVVAWIDAEEIVSRVVEINGTVSANNNQLHLGLTAQRDLSMLTTAGTAALTWTDDEVTRVAFLNVLSNVSRLFTFQHRGLAAGPPSLANLPQGHTGVFFTELQPSAPHYGAMRIFYALSMNTVPGVADQPSISASLLPNDTIRLAWSTPDPVVNGFRIERRVGDGAWLELGAFYEPSVRSETIVPVNREPHAFRIRAIADDGISAYSPEAVITFPTTPPPPPPPALKRRAIRK
jgi:hypothetical protein